MGRSSARPVSDPRSNVRRVTETPSTATVVPLHGGPHDGQALSTNGPHPGLDLWVQVPDGQDVYRLRGESESDGRWHADYVGPQSARYPGGFYRPAGT